MIWIGCIILELVLLIIQFVEDFTVNAGILIIVNFCLINYWGEKILKEMKKRNSDNDVRR